MAFRPPPSGPRLENQIVLVGGLAALTLVLLLVVRLLLPWLVGAGLVGLGLWFWHRHQATHRALHRQFYDQLEARDGRLSVLEFAMATGLTGAEARAFLDARAQEFWANFEPTDTGDVLYTFPMAPMRPSGTTPNCTHTSDGFRERLSSETAPEILLRLTTAELAQRLGAPGLRFLNDAVSPPSVDGVARKTLIAAAGATRRSKTATLPALTINNDSL
jgi:hypothetical protein